MATLTGSRFHYTDTSGKVHADAFIEYDTEIQQWNVRVPRPWGQQPYAFSKAAKTDAEAALLDLGDAVFNTVTTTNANRKAADDKAEQYRTGAL